MRCNAVVRWRNVIRIKTYVCVCMCAVTLFLILFQIDVFVTGSLYLAGAVLEVSFFFFGVVYSHSFITH